jgi:hypothetical protein
MPGLDPGIHAEAQPLSVAGRNSAWATGIGERSDAVQQTAMPGGDEGLRRRYTASKKRRRRQPLPVGGAFYIEKTTRP